MSICWAGIKFLFDRSRFSFPFPLTFIAGAMGRRAKNKQGDPLPLDADPDLNGSLKTSKPKSKPGLKAKGSAAHLHAKPGKRKLEWDGDDGRATKKPKEAQSAGKSKPQAKGMPAKKTAAKGKGKFVRLNGEKVNRVEDEVLDDDDSVGWEDVEDADMQAEARCVPVGSRCFIQFTVCLLAGHCSTIVTLRTKMAKAKILKSLPDLPGT